MDAVTLILNDHRLVDALFAEFEQTTDRQRKGELVQQMITLLAVHAHIEERELYPVMEEVLPDGKELVEHAEEEHMEAELMLARLQRLSPQAEEFDQVVQQLIDDVRHHIEEEESEHLPKLRDALDPKRSAELARRLEMAKNEVSAEPEITVEELQELAREHDVEGRSTMSKDELIEAVASKL